MLTLTGRTAAITGATGYQGMGIVHALLDAGMNVAMMTHFAGRSEEIITALPEEQRSRCAYFVSEGSDADCLEDIYRRFGSIDVVIPNHGGPIQPHSVKDINPEEFQWKLNHQVMGAFNLVQAAIPYLEKSNAGRIIFMTTAGAQNGNLGEGLEDNVARGGTIAMTYSLARELAPKGITVNCIAKSGFKDVKFRTDIVEDSPLLPHIPIGRCGVPEELGAAVQWLCSEEASFVTGAVINVSGGLQLG